MGRLLGTHPQGPLSGTTSFEKKTVVWISVVQGLCLAVSLGYVWWESNLHKRYWGICYIYCYYFVQGKEQRLHFAGAAVKRYSIPKASKMVGVARGHQRVDTLKPYSQKTSQSNHTRTTALSNSVKLSHASGATQDGRVMVERSDRMWSTGEGNGKPLQYSCLENPMTV